MKMKRFVSTCCGLGWLPIAPGTWGSVPVMAIFWLLAAGGASAAVINFVMIGLAVIGSVACVVYSPASIAATGRKDPGEVVMDEFAGQAVTYLLFAPVAAGHAAVYAIIGFLMFRVLDIIKPWPIRKLEKFPAGWGILLDDVLAGVIGCVIMNIAAGLGFFERLAALVPSGGNIGIGMGAVLGAVQGITEFLPVSSDGHLVLFEHFFGLKAESDQMLAFDLMVHLGTVLAILFVFRHSLIEFFKNLLHSGKYGGGPVEIYKKSPSVHILVLAIAANVATAVIGFPLKDYFQDARGSLWIVAAMWVITATALVITDYRRKTRVGLREFGIMAAVIVGVAQASALMPAISRSGMTICAAVLLGLHRRWAVELSFLAGVPAILGAVAIELIKEHEVIAEQGFSFGSVVVGPVVAMVVGIAALEILLAATRKAKLRYFGYYCYALAAALAGYLIYQRF